MRIYSDIENKARLQYYRGVVFSTFYQRKITEERERKSYICSLLSFPGRQQQYRTVNALAIRLRFSSGTL